MIGALPAGAAAYEKTFAKGSLIIPMDTASQTSVGAMASYGLLYRWLATEEITIYWIINPTKTTVDAIDFSVNGVKKVNNAAYPPAVTSPFQNAQGTNIPANRTVDYRGAPYVIEAQQADRAIELLATAAELANFRDAAKKWVNIHEAQIEFTADVATAMNSRPPRVALLGNGAVNVLRAYMNNAGLGLTDFPTSEGCYPGSTAGCALTNGKTGHGEVYDVLDAEEDLSSRPGFPFGRLNATGPTGEPIYRILWTPHWDGKNVTDLQNIRENVARFNATGAAIFAECASIETFESSYKLDTLPGGGGGGGGGGVNIPNGTVYLGGICDENADCTGPGAKCAKREPDDQKVCVECTRDSDCGAGKKCQKTRTCQDCAYNKCVPSAQVNNCALCAAPYGTQPAAGADLGIYCDNANECKTGLFCGSYDLVDPLNACLACTVNADCGAGNTCITNDGTCNHAYCSNTGCGSPANPGAGGPAPPAPGKLYACAPGCDCSGNIQITSTFSTTLSVSLAGDPVTRFMSQCGLVINALDSGYPDTANDSILFGHPTHTFSQKGDWPFTGTGGHVHNWHPLSDDSADIGYNDGNIFRLAKSQNSVDTFKHDWDFLTFRPADTAGKGPVLYLAGHDYSGTVAGTRLVMATMYNLQFELTSTELARSEPVVYVAGNRIFLGTFRQTSPPGAQTWLQGFDASTGYDPATKLAASWIFPYHPGHMRSYVDFTTGLSAFEDDKDIDVADVLAATSPAARTVFTSIGGALVDFLPAAFNAGCVDNDLDGTCDLAERLAITGDPVQYHSEKHLISMVRGHCLAHQGGDNFSPSSAQCDIGGAANTAKLGGVDHSTPGIAGTSDVVFNAGARPEVLYFGGRDGQLHAVYLGGGSGWTGAAGPFSPPAVGTELWAYIPEPQLPLLRSNNAAVDGVVLVRDVKIDLLRNGSFTDRTILVMSSGESSENIFALDVSDPTDPTLLWSIVRGIVTDQPHTSSVAAPLGLTSARKYGALNAPASTAANHASSFYDYSDLGKTFGLALGYLGTGTNADPIALACTNYGPGTSHRLEVFAIDLATGKRVWQFERSYALGDNTIPPTCGTLRADDGIDKPNRVLAGGMDGRLWEIDMLTGLSPNVISGFDYALVDTDDAAGHQPITTEAVAFRLDGSTAANKAQTAIVFGTAGADWVPTTVAGKLHVVAYPPTRTPGGVAQQQGLAEPVASFPVTLRAGESLRGRPRVVGDTIIVTTSSGRFSGDITDASVGAGRLMALDVSAGTVVLEQEVGKTFGGVALKEEKIEGTNQVRVTAYGATPKEKFKIETTIEVPPPPTTPSGIFRILRWREIPIRNY